MVKSKKEVKMTIPIIAGVCWFLLISFITAQTEYNSLIANSMADPRGTSTQLEGILNILVVIISFIPSGFALAYPYIKKNFNDHKVSRIILLSLVLAAVLYIPFSWYNFIINFGN